MANVEIYCTQLCPYCTRARMMLDKKGVSYIEYDLDEKPELRPEMEKRSGRTSVPQIFIDDFHVGGFDDMAELDVEGILDEKLGIA
jgi:glutaredoxin 3